MSTKYVRVAVSDAAPTDVMVRARSRKAWTGWKPRLPAYLRMCVLNVVVGMLGRLLV